VMLFRLIGMLFGLFVWNSNRELRRTTISFLPQNSRIVAILVVPGQRICVWLHRYYFYSENNSYFRCSRAIQTYRVCLDRAKNSIRIGELRIVSEDSEKNSDFSVSARIVKR
jgi:hypothetical protein